MKTTKTKRQVDFLITLKRLYRLKIIDVFILNMSVFSNQRLNSLVEENEDIFDPFSPIFNFVSYLKEIQAQNAPTFFHEIEMEKVQSGVFHLWQQLASVTEETSESNTLSEEIGELVSGWDNKCGAKAMTKSPYGSLSIKNDDCYPFFPCDECGCSSLKIKFLIVIQVLMLLFILSANLAIIFVIFNMEKGTRNRRNGSTRIFKLSLAFADLLMGLSTLPAAIDIAIDLFRGDQENLYSDLLRLSERSVETPKAIILGSGCIIATISSIWSILAIQVDLFLKLRWPMQQRTGKLMTTSRALIITAFIWSFSIAVSYGILGLGFSYGLHKPTLFYSVVVNDRFTAAKIISLAVFAWALPFTITIPLGVALVLLIRKTIKNLAKHKTDSFPNRSFDRRKKESLRKTREATSRTIAVEVVYVATFLPCIISNIYHVSKNCDRSANMFKMIADYVLLSGSFMNLFVYHLMWREFNLKLKSLLCMAVQTTRRNSVKDCTRRLTASRRTQITITDENPNVTENTNSQ